MGNHEKRLHSTAFLQSIAALRPSESFTHQASYTDIVGVACGCCGKTLIGDDLRQQLRDLEKEKSDELLSLAVLRNPRVVNLRVGATRNQPTHQKSS
jgi:hypothetical protein